MGSDRKRLEAHVMSADAAFWEASFQRLCEHMLLDDGKTLRKRMDVYRREARSNPNRSAEDLWAPSDSPRASLALGGQGGRGKQHQ